MLLGARFQLRAVDLAARNIGSKLFGEPFPVQPESALFWSGYVGPKIG